jgi:hypothetical protein
MSDTAVEVPRTEMEGKVVKAPLVNTAKTYKKGWLMNVNSSGYVKSGADATAERFAGVAASEVEVKASGSAGDESILLQQRGVILFTFTSTLTQADLEMAAYVKDNYRLARFADVTYLVFAGIIKRIVSTTQAYVDIEAAIPQVPSALANAVS